MNLQSDSKNHTMIESTNTIKAKDVETIKKISGESLDIVKQNVQKLKEIFPEVFCEDKIDFKKLEEVLGEYIDDSDERYRFEWHGKSNAIKIAQTHSRGTLRPCKEESKNWGTTENLYIEGDNLEVLKLLQKSYQGKIKMIYIDPPYNTGNDFIYPDDYSDNLENYLRITGQKDEDGNKTTTNSETSGRYHTNWLNMMYPRLKLARNLLSEDGVIFISIDDNEIENLKKVCDEVFGENNRIAVMIWQTTPGSNTGTNIITVTEYVLVYAKNKTMCTFNTIIIKDDSKYTLKDEYVEKRGKYILNKLDRRMTGLHYSDALNYPIEMPDGQMIYPGSTDYKNNDGWNYRWSKTKVEWGLKNGFIVLKEVNGKWNAYFKQYFKVDNNDNEIIRSLPFQNLITLNQFNSTQGTKEIMNIFNKKYFDYPKPSEYVKYLLSICERDDDIILDFFSGSSTTAHAVMQLNAEDNGKRKFIMVQLPEECDKKSEAYKAGYKNICEIGKERIRRAGDKIVEENKDKEGIEDLDIGFKVFKLDTSNIKPWNPDYYNLEMTLEDSVDNFVPDRTQEDIVYEIMLKYGIDLTYPVEAKEINNRRIFSVGCGALLLCLDDDITLEEVNEIVKLKDELKPETCRVVFKDNGFKTDSVKTNAVEILKKNNIKEVMSI